MRYLITIEAPDVDFDTAGHPRFTPSEVQSEVVSALDYADMPIKLIRFEEAITLNRTNQTPAAVVTAQATKPAVTAGPAVAEATVNPNLTSPNAIQTDTPGGETTPAQNQ